MQAAAAAVVAVEVSGGPLVAVASVSVAPAVFGPPVLSSSAPPPVVAPEQQLLLLLLPPPPLASPPHASSILQVPLAFCAPPPGEAEVAN